MLRAQPQVLGQGQRRGGGSPSYSVRTQPNFDPPLPLQGLCSVVAETRNTSNLLNCFMGVLRFSYRGGGGRQLTTGLLGGGV